MHELIEFLNHNTIVKAFGLSLLHSLWQGAAIAAFLWLLLKITAHAAARLRYWFALTALCSLLVCFACTLHIQLSNLSATGRIVTETEAFVLLSADTDKHAVMEKNLLQELETGWNLLLYQAQQQVVYFFLAWTIGCFIYSFRFFTGLYYLRELKQTSHPLPESWLHRTNRLQQKLGLHKEIRLLASDKANTPLTFGWLKPVIIFPLSMLSLLPEEQVESILLHELAHIRRNDYLINLLQSIIEITFFFNPGYWYLSKVLEREREHICDDLVLAHSTDSHTYARALTNLAELSTFHNSRLALNIARKEKGLLFRIKRIIQPSNSEFMEKSIKRRSYQLASLIIACTLLVFLTIDVNGNSSHTESSQKEENQPAAAETVRKISGVVLSKYGGASLPGVAVTIKNSNTGTVTDFDGYYSLNAQPTDTLVFSFVGFHTKEVAVNNQNYHPVILESIEKVENSSLVLNDIKVRQNPDQPEKSSTLAIGRSNNTEGNYPESNAGIFVIPEEADIKIFAKYITNAAVTVEDIQQHGRKISRSELDAINPSEIKSNLTISSEETGQKRSVTLVKLKEATATTENSQTAAKPQPLFIILEEDDLSSAKNPGNKEYIVAMAAGRQVQDLNSIDSDQIASIHVLKGSQAIEVAGEAAKDGVMFISLKNTTANTTAKGTATIKSTKDEDTAAKAVTVSTKGNIEKGTDAQPLYILLEPGTLGDNPGPEAYKAAIASGRQLDDPHSIDPATIASIDVVKDASATSLGEVPENGVVFITLKKPAAKGSASSIKGTASNPLTIILEEGAIEGLEEGSEAFKAAVARGRKLSGAVTIGPEYYLYEEKLNQKLATEIFGEAGKNGVLLLSLKRQETSVSESEDNINDHFRVFPNPSDGVVKVSFQNNKKQHVKLDVLDPNGNKVHTFVNGNLKKGTHQYEWNAGKQQAGIYTIMLTRDNEVKTSRLVLQ